MLIRLFTIVLIASLLPACTSSQQDPPLRLRVLSYNIHHGKGNDGKFDYQRLADVINKAEPDLVALQEVDVKTKRSQGVDQAAKLGELTGMHHYFAEAMPYLGGSYGEAVLSRFPIKGDYLVRLPAEAGQEPRAAATIWVEPWVTDEGRPIRVTFAGTHLCHQSHETRTKQAQQLVDMRRFGPLSILAGDFNFTPDEEPYKVITGDRYKPWLDTAATFGNPKDTYPADQPKMRIDYVFVRPAKRWRVIDVQVLHEPVASDHAPVLVELEYVPPAP